jgi:type IX secretion system PorP/SprF family membrane protein
MKAILFSTIIIFSFASNAQQEHISSMFWNNYSEINPATVGMESIQQGVITYRNQWQGVSGAPRTLFGNYNGCVGRHHGVGVNVTSGSIGNMNFQEVQVNYSYKHFLSNSQQISLGIAPSYNRQVFSDDFYPMTPTSNSLNFNAGVAYKGNKIFAGIGATQLFSSRFDDATIGMGLAPHYYAHFRRSFGVSRKLNFYLEGVFRTDLVKSQADFNARVVILNNIMLGVGYRLNNALIWHVSWDIKGHFRVGYAYDRSTNMLASISNGTHEFTLGYLVKYRDQNRRSDSFRHRYYL